MQPVFLKHREKVLAHAEGKLASQGRHDQKDRLLLYKKFLKIENHRLRLKHNAGGGGLEIARQRATLVDIVLRHLYEPVAEASVGEDLALVAIGGYGRGELNPCSDVDLMFLHEGSSKMVSEQIRNVVQSILYMLWDIGFKVGHSTRSISGAIKQANSDMLSKTSLLEARFVAGSGDLFKEFKAAFQKRCVDGYQREYIRDRIQNQKERHAKHGDSVFMQEPNVKNGCGGLRDYQNLLWMSYFKEGIASTEDLVVKKFLHERERRELDRAYDFLMRVRTELHYLNGRPMETLGLNFQFQVASKFDYPQKNALRRSEAFMRDYYTAGRDIYRLTELLCERLAIAEPASFTPRLLGMLHRRPKRESFDGFYAEDGRIYAEASRLFKDDPYRMMRLFQHAQQRQLRLSPELQQLIRRRLPLVDRTFQYSRAARITFSAILSRKGEVGRILRMMHEVDFLGRYLPEFGQLTCLVQHEFFHRYTADEHTLVCIEKLDSVIDTENPKLKRYQVLFQKLDDPYVLYLALLLHDVGKAVNAKNHAEASAVFAQRVARRLQLTPDQRRSVITLVDNHLTLSQTAQRRNLDDSATIEDFATTVKTQTDLDYLMLLTLADGQGTGDENWSDWKESLVWALYENTSQYFADSAAFFRQSKIERDELRDEVTRMLPKDYADEIDAHFEYMPDIYLRITEPDAIATHIRLFRRFMELRESDPSKALAPAVEWIAHPEKAHSEVCICTWNRQALLAKIAGSFAAAQLNILSADIYTRTDDLVLDIFRVCDTNYQPVMAETDMQIVEKHLGTALGEEKFDFRPLIQRSTRRRGFHLSQEIDFPTKIVVANDLNPIFTIVEIQTPDRLGLLYSLLMAFAKSKIDIALSRIATEKGAAIDSFYVRDAEGRKITDPEDIKRLQTALHKAATAPPAKSG